MPLRNVKIRSQIRLSFGIILSLFLVLGYISWDQTNKITELATELYNHPQTVLRALGNVKSDVLQMEDEVMHLVYKKDQPDIRTVIAINDSLRTDIANQIEIINNQYLGPRSDLYHLKNEFSKWEHLNSDFFELYSSGKQQDKVLENTYEQDKQLKTFISVLEPINTFASAKSINFLNNAKLTRDNLHFRMNLYIALFLVFSFLISYSLANNILFPIGKLSESTKNFVNGNYNARSTYKSRNEFGALTKSFNHLANNIQQEIEIKNNVTEIGKLMLGQNELRPIVQKLLAALIKKTNSQTAAIYFLNEAKNSFNHFESIGLNPTDSESFAADTKEGEFGMMLADQQSIQIIQVPDEANFSFRTVTGIARPREILSIPITESGQLIGVISLSTLRKYTAAHIATIEQVRGSIVSRINGLITYQKVMDMSSKLDIQNKDLQEKSRELALQSDELREYNIELELQKTMLDNANQLKSAFLSNMSHELRTPLNSVIALSGVLNRRLKGNIAEEEYKYLGIIERNGKNLLTLINNILDLSRIESGKEEIILSKFSLKELIESIVTVIEPNAREKLVSLKAEFASELPMIVSDSEKCNHVFQNIISNAVKFTEHGSVEISATQADQNIHIIVKDSGIGMQAEDLPFIFDEFRQADHKTSRKFGGTGLGLAIAKKYINLLHGSIEVESQPGLGSTFHIRIPIEPPIIETDNKDIEVNHFSVPVSEEQDQKIKSHKSKHILIIEDSEAAIIQISEIVKSDGYQLVVAENAIEAFHHLNEKVPDGIILDLMMPEIDGFQVLKQIRSNASTIHIPVLVLTAKHLTKEDLAYLKHNHIYQLLQKGDVKKADLLQNLHNMIFENEVASAAAGSEILPTAGNNIITPKITGRKPRILVIEDILDNLETVKALLGDSYEIITAMDGKKGFELAKTASPDLILLDISLPEMDGYAVFREIRKISQLDAVPIIALTAKAMKGDRAELLQFGFDDYISKPIDTKIFEHTIQHKLNEY